MNTLKPLLRRVIARQLEARVQKLIREKHLKVVAVTGSYGKTSTKLAIASVLRQKYRVLAQEGNYNTEIGLPLSIFELKVPDTLVNPLAWFRVLDQIDKKLKADYPYDVLVLEMGVDHPGEMAIYTRYITPDVGIVTAIAPVHLEGLGSIEAIAREKMALPQASKAILLNAESERVMQEAAKLAAPVQTYGVEKGGVHFSDIKRSQQLTLNASLKLNDGEVRIKTQMLGRHGLAALAAAAAVGEEMGLEPAQIKAGLEAIQPFAGRMRVLDGKNGATVIDDTYNAAPDAVKAAIATLLELPGRHIAILGSMNELGELAEAAHREVGAAAAKIDILITVGSNANQYTIAGAVAAGMKPEQTHACASPYAAGKLVADLLKAGDVVLTKGSQNGVFTEEAVALLLADPADRAKLVRQSADWQAKKHAQFPEA